MSTELDELAAALDEMSSPGSENEKCVPSGQRPCPICGETMTADNFSGFPIDACAMHGIWLDNGELRCILARRRDGERQRFNKAIQRARKDGKLSGVLLGGWSFLLDD